jgi:hypothetical protein
MTVAKLRDAGERKRRENGKCEGRKSHAELTPSWLFWALTCAGVAPRGQRSLREISAELAMCGFMNERGNAFSASSISSMLEAR